MSEPVRIEVTVAAPVEEVWRALRDPAQLRRWHGWLYPDLDAEIATIYGERARELAAQRVLKVEPADTFELEEVAGGTLVRIVRAVPEPGSEWADYFADITEGWISFVHQLRFMLERHPGQDRRTLFFQVDRTEVPLEALVATSPAAGGDLWFASANQRGVVVDDLGPGLAVVGVKPADGDAAMTIVTTYGLDDGGLADTRDAWTAWWHGHHPDAPAAVT